MQPQASCALGRAKGGEEQAEGLQAQAACASRWGVGGPLSHIGSKLRDSLLCLLPGEMDKLALEEAGFMNVVSVPDGAPAKVKEGAVPAPDADTKYSYLWNCRAVLDQATRVLMATDNDPPGHALAEELARRLGQRHSRQLSDMQLDGFHGNSCGSALDTVWPVVRKQCWCAFGMCTRHYLYQPRPMQAPALPRLPLGLPPGKRCRLQQSVIMWYSATITMVPLLRRLQDQLSLAGRERCYRVQWENLPEAQEAAADLSEEQPIQATFRKDANEVLMKDGPQALRYCIDQAEPLPIRGLFRSGPPPPPLPACHVSSQPI